MIKSYTRETKWNKEESVGYAEDTNGHVPAPEVHLENNFNWKTEAAGAMYLSY